MQVRNIVIPLTQPKPKTEQSTFKENHQTHHKVSKAIQRTKKQVKRFKSPEKIYTVNNKPIPVHFNGPSHKKKSGASKSSMGANWDIPMQNSNKSAYTTQCANSRLFSNQHGSDYRSVNDKSGSRFTSPMSRNKTQMVTNVKYQAPELWGCIVPKHLQRLNEKQFERVTVSNGSRVELKDKSKGKRKLYKWDTEQSASSQILLENYIARKFKNYDKGPEVYESHGRNTSDCKESITYSFSESRKSKGFNHSQNIKILTEPDCGELHANTYDALNQHNAQWFKAENEQMHARRTDLTPYARVSYTEQSAEDISETNIPNESIKRRRMGNEGTSKYQSRSGYALKNIKQLNGLIKWRSKVIQKIEDSVHSIKCKYNY